MSTTGSLNLKLCSLMKTCWVSFTVTMTKNCSMACSVRYRTYFLVSIGRETEASVEDGGLEGGLACAFISSYINKALHPCTHTHARTHARTHTHTHLVLG